ncbi:pleckstrin homology-like domain family B member 1 [Polyodon spathula]|uniref:pleckstrin homology-like domain family B member 1 n=1 Tax=Polyodon spathula TaxID=7913 RepID=UPI001B7EBC1E|nr:pleckstrin homology-like domain family B member 1 [Polyodon spathula]
MENLNRNLTEHGRQTHQILQGTPLDLIETGKGLKVQAERPHLVSLGSGRLSTAITLLPLAEGRTTVGSAAKDINVQGPGIAAQHCYIVNQNGVITLHPCGNPCSIDGIPVTKPVRLTQGRGRSCTRTTRASRDLARTGSSPSFSSMSSLPDRS